MPQASYNYYTQKKLCPQFFPEDVRTIGSNLVANQTIKSGTIMGFVSSTAANDVWTLTPSASLTAGSGVLSVYGTQVTVLSSDTATTLATKINAALLAAYGYNGNAVAVTGGPWSSGTAVVVTAANAFANQPQTISIVSQNFTGGTLSAAHTTTGVAFGAWAPYASGNSDGSQVARGILLEDVIVDAAGMIYLGQALTLTGIKNPTIAIATNGGQWNTADLTGLDAGAVTSLGKLVAGSLAAGGLLELAG